ncbi:hypothetical protein EUX98_g7982 [Antrodiella citrinella]|uniref:Uncharacterized protein n=1 Tax=Antrodiella citrinella TaxID=2447956 RepID=A0A4S4MCG9_9APHY|nr:hypothetical protein EUX98_g7982 [Antrodiella citrinella]
MPNPAPSEESSARVPRNRKLTEKGVELVKLLPRTRPRPSVEAPENSAPSVDPPATAAVSATRKKAGQQKRKTTTDAPAQKSTPFDSKTAAGSRAKDEAESGHKEDVAVEKEVSMTAGSSTAKPVQANTEASNLVKAIVADAKNAASSVDANPASSAIDNLDHVGLTATEVTAGGIYIPSIESAPTPAQRSVRASPPLHDVPPDVVPIPEDEQVRQPSPSPVPGNEPTGTHSMLKHVPSGEVPLPDDGSVIVRPPSLSPVAGSHPVGTPSTVPLPDDGLVRRSARGRKSPLLSDDSMEPDDSDDDASDFAQTDLRRRTHYSHRGEPVVAPSSEDEEDELADDGDTDSQQGKVRPTKKMSRTAMGKQKASAETGKQKKVADTEKKKKNATTGKQKKKAKAKTTPDDDEDPNARDPEPQGAAFLRSEKLVLDEIREIIDNSKHDLGGEAHQFRPGPIPQDGKEKLIALGDLIARALAIYSREYRKPMESLSRYLGFGVTSFSGSQKNDFNTYQKAYAADPENARRPGELMNANSDIMRTVGSYLMMAISRLKLRASGWIPADTPSQPYSDFFKVPVASDINPFTASGPVAGTSKKPDVERSAERKAPKSRQRRDIASKEYIARARVALGVLLGEAVVLFKGREWLKYAIDHSVRLTNVPCNARTSWVPGPAYDHKTHPQGPVGPGLEWQFEFWTAEEQALDVASLAYAEIPLVVEAEGKVLFRVMDSLDYKKTSRDESKKRGPPEHPMLDEDLRKKRKRTVVAETTSRTSADSWPPKPNPLNVMAGPSSRSSIAGNDEGRDPLLSDVGGDRGAPADMDNARAPKSRLDELRERLMGSRNDLTAEDQMLGNELAGYKLNGDALLALGWNGGWGERVGGSSHLCRGEWLGGRVSTPTLSGCRN